MVLTGISLLIYPWLVSAKTKSTKTSISSSVWNVFLNCEVYQIITLMSTTVVVSLSPWF